MAGFLGQSPPFELVKAWMCEYYHCLPSQLDNEPADKVMLYYQLNAIYEEGASKRTVNKPKRL